MFAVPDGERTPLEYQLFDGTEAPVIVKIVVDDELEFVCMMLNVVPEAFDSQFVNNRMASISPAPEAPLMT